MDSIIISGDITNKTVKEYLRAKTIESLANAYNQAVNPNVTGWYDLNIALQKLMAAEIKNRTIV